MNDDMREHGCEQYQDGLSELSLGVLTGRDRARVLAHVEDCPRCAEELEQLSYVADAVVQVAPEAEPPLGFEVRLFERMGISDVRRRRARPPRWAIGALSAAAAVAALAVGLTLGLSSSPSTTSSAPPPARGVVAASLVEHGNVVGRVTAHGGTHPWMSMMLFDSSVHGTVNCIVLTSDGVSHQVGTFVARDGYGAWIAPLHVAPGAIRTAEVVTPGGAVIATAALG